MKHFQQNSQIFLEIGAGPRTKGCFFCRFGWNPCQSSHQGLALKINKLITILANKHIYFVFCSWDISVFEWFCHNPNSTSTKLGLTWKWVCTPPHLTYPTTHPNSTSIIRSLRSTFDVALTTTASLRTTTTTKTTSTTTTTTAAATTTTKQPKTIGLWPHRN